MSVGRAADLAVAALVGALVGALLVLSIDAFTREAPPSTGVGSKPKPSVEVVYADDLPLQTHTSVLAWAPGGLPEGAEREAESIPGVASATEVVAGVAWISSSRSADGSIIDAPPDGFRIPVEVAVVQPREYARFVPRSERDVVRSLSEDGAILAETSAELRRTRTGGRLALDVGNKTVTGVVADGSANGYEMLLAGAMPRSWSGNRYLLIEMKRGRADLVQRRLKRAFGSDYRLRVRTRGETPFLRYGDAVQPQLVLKQSFGEYAARLGEGGFFDVDPTWRSENIRTAEVPILGKVTCHRALFPQLRAALNGLLSQGLGAAIDPGDFGGCFSPRFINADPNKSLSHHAWGVSIDFNVSANGYGAEPTMDERVVDVMQSWGFTWGGEWLIPDGMHFEWVSFPS